MPGLFKKRRTEIAPEEILLDKDSFGKLEIPIKTGGLFAALVLAVIVLMTFWGRALWLQIWQGEYYSVKSLKNNVRLYRSRPPRGIVYDRNGQMLAGNIPNFNLMIIPADIPEGEAQKAWIKRFSGALDKNEEEVAAFVKELNKNSTLPVILDADLTQKILVGLESAMPELPGVFINKETKRNYENGYYFAHILGYTGKVSSDNLKSDSYYSPIDLIGKAGLEAQYENELRGEPGKIAVFVDSNNTILKTLEAEGQAPGDNLVLSVDGELQKLLTDALRAKMADTASKGAAAAVINVRTGEILALASLPSFDNNIFSSPISAVNFKNITLFNRAIGGTYPSGSTIKPFIASAALAEKSIDPNYKIDDTLGYISVPNQYDPSVIYTYRDWRAHGFVDMRRALAVSANVYFYVIGGGYKNIKGLGIDLIDKYLNLFGFGSKSGIDIPGEANGLVPGPAWKKATKNEGWFTGDTYNVSIGQGDVLVTPLQMAAAVSSIANGGALLKPHLVSKITDENGRVVKEFGPETARKINIDDSQLGIVREGMRGAVTEGSAWFLNDLPIKVAGKTGTAQVTSTFRKTNAWFTGFAPYDNPEIALAIVIEGAGEGSSAAVPVAKEVFNWYYLKSLSKN